MSYIDSADELLASTITLFIYIILVYYLISMMNKNFYLMEQLHKATYIF